MPKVRKPKKVEPCLQIPFFSRNTRLYTLKGSLTIVPKFLPQKSKQLVLWSLKGVTNYNCSKKISEWCTGDAKCSFNNSSEKHFAKSQNVFCSKSGNVLKKIIILREFSFSTKQTIVYIRGRQLDNRAELSPSNVRNFFRLTSKKDRKRKFFFSNTNFHSKHSPVHENALLTK